MNNVVALHNSPQNDLNSLEYFAKIASIAFRSNLLPTAIKTVEAAQYIAMRGAALGINPLIALDHIFQTKSGKLAVSAELARSLVAQSGGRWKTIELSEKQCVLTGFRDALEETITVEWTDIERAGLAKPRGGYPSVYATYPKDMLYAYTFRRLSQRLWPDVLMGMAAYDDLERDDAERVDVAAEKPRGLIPEKKVQKKASVLNEPYDPNEVRTQIEPTQIPEAAIAVAEKIEKTGMATEVTYHDLETGEVINQQAPDAEGFDSKNETTFDPTEMSHSLILDQAFDELKAPATFRALSRSKIEAELASLLTPLDVEAVKEVILQVKAAKKKAAQ